jgi:hypothetical protein
MDRVLLNKILECDYTLSNVLMRTCKKFNRYIHDDKILMHKLAEHYQPIIEKEIHFEMARLFTDHLNVFGTKVGYNIKNIENILINDSHKDRKNKISEVILLEKNGIVSKSLTLKKVDSLFKARLNEVREVKRLGDVYLHSIGFRNTQESINEKKMTELIRNYSILLDTIISRNQAKYVDQTRFPANTYLKYFILMIAVLYVRYTFMK